MPVSVGIYLNPRTPGPDEDRRILRENVDQVLKADRMGFKAVWMTEHAFSGQNVYSDPLILAGYLTGRVAMPIIGFAVAVAPLHDPVRFATQVAVLDNLSDGRVVASIGTGAGEQEFLGYGADWQNRVARTDEFQHALRGMWAATERYDHEGEFYQVHFKGRILPRIVQSPHPPMPRATARTDLCERLGREGEPALLGAHSASFLFDHFVGPHMQGLAEAGLSVERREWLLERSGVLNQVYVRADDEDPALIEPYHDYFKETFGANAFRTDEFGPKKNRGMAPAEPRGPGLVSREDSDDFVRHQFSIGTADEVFERLEPQITGGGARHLMLWMNWGVMPYEMVMGSIERFGRGVLPRLERLVPRALAG
jgi:alkanesulfonate monooxygenase SsuD/methylene tetrahydromethanopterin reductase-like flavin-dependent oxidoreductase (luciferase family)